MCYVMLVLSPIYLSISIHFSVSSNIIFHFYFHCHNLSPSHHHLLPGFLNWFPHFHSQHLLQPIPHPVNISKLQMWSCCSVFITYQWCHITLRIKSNSFKAATRAWQPGLWLPVQWHVGPLPPLTHYAQPHRSFTWVPIRLIPTSRPSFMLSRLPVMASSLYCIVSSFSDFLLPHWGLLSSTHPKSFLLLICFTIYIFFCFLV